MGYLWNSQDFIVQTEGMMIQTLLCVQKALEHVKLLLQESSVCMVMSLNLRR